MHLGENMLPQELEIITSMLKQNHPAFLGEHQYEEKLPYLKLSEAEFDKKVEYLKDRISSYNDTQVNCALCSLFASLGDSHTMFFYPRSKPLDVGFIKCDRGVYLSKVDKDFEDKLLSRVISIGGQDIEHLISKAYKLIPSETKEWSQYRAVKLLSDPEFLALLGVKAGDTISIKFADDTTEYSFPTKSNSVSMPKPLGNRYFYDVKNLNNIPIIRYGICKEGFGNWDNFLADVNVIKQGSNVVVDLRSNDGGDSAVFDKNIAAVLREKHCSGVALVDNGTFASGICAALSLKELGFKLVGENMAQPLITYGSTMFFENVCGKYSFKVTTELYNLKDAFNLPDNTTNRPDELVSHTVLALQEGRDLMLDRAVELCHAMGREK